MKFQVPPNQVSLRIWHRDVDPRKISEQLGVVPEVLWRRGDLRMTPKGPVLQGEREQSYWCYTATSNGDLVDVLNELVDMVLKRELWFWTGGGWREN